MADLSIKIKSILDTKQIQTDLKELEKKLSSVPVSLSVSNEKFQEFKANIEKRSIFLETKLKLSNEALEKFKAQIATKSVSVNVKAKIDDDAFGKMVNSLKNRLAREKFEIKMDAGKIETRGTRQSNVRDEPISDIRSISREQLYRMANGAVDSEFFKRAKVSEIKNMDALGNLKSIVLQGEQANGVVKKLQFSLRTLEDGNHQIQLLNVKDIDKTEKALDSIAKKATDLKRQLKQSGDKDLIASINRLQANGQLTSDTLKPIQNQYKDRNVNRADEKAALDAENKRLGLIQKINIANEKGLIDEQTKQIALSQIESARGKELAKDRMQALRLVEQEMNRIKEMATFQRNSDAVHERALRENERFDAARTAKIRELNNKVSQAYQIGDRELLPSSLRNQLKLEINSATTKSELKSLETEINRIYDSIINKNAKLKNDNGILDVKKRLQELAPQIRVAGGDIERLANQIQNMFNGREVTRNGIEQAKRELKELELQLKQFQQTARSGTVVDINAERLDRIIKNTKTNLSEASNELQKYFREMYGNHAAVQKISEGFDKNGASVTNLKVRLQDGKKEVQEFTYQINHANKELVKMGEALVNNPNKNLGVLEQLKIAMERVPVWFAGTTAFYGSINMIRDMTKEILELDKAYTNLSRVAGSNTNVDFLFNQSLKMSSELGNNAKDVLKTVEEISRSYDNLSEKQQLELAKAATIASNVSDMKANEAMETLIAGLNGYGLQTDKAMDIVDKLNEVDNKNSVSTLQLAEAMQKASAVSKTFGLDIDHLNGLVTGIAATTMESGKVVGNSIKSILPNLTMTKKGTEALASVGIATKDANGGFRDAQDIIWDLGNKWKTLSSTQQQSIALAIGGKYHITRVAAAFNNWGLVVKATNDSLNAQGSAVKENERFQNSLEARMNRLKNAFTELAKKIGESILVDALITGTTAMKGLMEVAGFVSDKMGALPVVLGIVGTAMIAYKIKTMGAVESTKSFYASLANLPARLSAVASSLKPGNVWSKMNEMATSITGKVPVKSTPPPVLPVTNLKETSILQSNANAIKIQETAQRELNSVMKANASVVNTMSNNLKSYGTNLSTVTKVTDIATRTTITDIAALKNKTSTIGEVANVTSKSTQIIQSSLATQTGALNGVGGATSQLGLRFAQLRNIAGAALSFIGSIALPVVAFMAIGAAIDYVMKKVAEAKQKKEEEERLNKSLAGSYAKHGDEIRKLADEYERMEKLGTPENDVKFLDVQSKLAKLMPGLTKTVDENGQAHLKRADAIKESINYAQKAAEVEERNADATMREANVKILEKAKKLQDEIKENEERTKKKTVTKVGNQEVSENSLVAAKAGMVEVKSQKRVDEEDLALKKSQSDLKVITQDVTANIVQQAIAKSKLGDQTRELTQEQKNLVKSYAETKRAASNVTAETDLTAFESKMNTSINKVAENMKKIPRELSSFFTGKQLETMGEGQTNALNKAADSVRYISERYRTGQISVNDYKNSLNAVSKSLETNGFDSKIAFSAVMSLKDAYNKMASGAENAKNKIKELTDEQKEEIRKSTDIKHAIEDLTGVSDEYYDELKNAGGVYKLLHDKQNLDEEAKYRLKNATEKLTAAYPELIENGQIRTDKMFDEFKRQDELRDLTAKEASGKITAEEAKTLATLRQTDERIRKQREELNSINALRQAAINAAEMAESAISRIQAKIDQGYEPTGQDINRLSKLQERADRLRPEAQRFAAASPMGQITNASFAPMGGRNFSVVDVANSNTSFADIQTNRTFGVENRNFENPSRSIDRVNYYSQMPTGHTYEMSLNKSQTIVSILEAYLKRLDEKSEEYRFNMQLITQEQENQLRFAKDQIQFTESEVNKLYQELEWRKNIRDMTEDQKKELDEISNRYTDQLKHLRNLSVTFEELQSSITKMKFDILINAFDEVIEKTETHWKKIEQSWDDKASYWLQVADKVEQNSPRFKIDQSVIRINQLETHKRLLAESIQTLEYQTHLYSDNEKIVSELNDRIQAQKDAWQNVTLEILDLQKNINEMKKEAAQKGIEQLRTNLEHQRDMEIEKIENVRTAQTKAHDEKMKQLDKESSRISEMYDKKKKELSDEKERDDFEREMGDKNSKKQELIAKISRLSFDNSLTGKAKRAELQRELDDLNKETKDRLRDKSYEDRQKALESSQEKDLKAIEDKKKAEDEYNEKYLKNLDEQSKAIEQKYKIILENQGYWKQLEKQFMDGNMNVISDELQKMLNLLQVKDDNNVFNEIKDRYKDTLGEAEGFIDTLTANMKDMHEIIKKNLTDDLLDALKVINAIMNSNVNRVSNTSPATGVQTPFDGFVDYTTVKAFTAMKIRSRDDEKSSSIGVIPKGKNVKKLEDSGEWVKIEYNGKIGFVTKNLLESKQKQQIPINTGIVPPRIDIETIVKPVIDIFSKIKTRLPDFPMWHPASDRIEPQTNFGDIIINVDQLNANDRNDLENLGEILKQKLKRQGKVQ